MQSIDSQVLDDVGPGQWVAVCGLHQTSATVKNYSNKVDPFSVPTCAYYLQNT